MKRFELFVLSSLLALSGCSTVLISSPGSLSGVDVKGAKGGADRTIMVANEGYYFFQAWPIVSGSASWNSKAKEIFNDVEFFSEQLDGTQMVNIMSRYADSRNCDLVDVVINNRSQYNIGLFGVMDWFNTVIGYQAVTYSGVLRPRQSSAEESEK